MHLSCVNIIFTGKFRDQQRWGAPGAWVSRSALWLPLAFNVSYF